MRRIVLAILVSGCAAEQPPVGYAPGLGTPANPVPGYDAYALKSRVSLPLGNADVTDAIADLRAFAQHGGTTLLAQNEGSSALLTLNALPSSLRTKLEGWIDLELDKQKLGALTARQAIGDIATMADTAVNQFTVESQLEITPMGAQHTLRDLNFSPANLDIVIPIGGLTSDVIIQKTTATVAEGGALEVGDQHYKLGFGAHAWHAINLATSTMYGGDLSIVEHLDCTAVAQAVAARCVSGTCVGHASEIAAVCQNGLTELVDHLRTALAPIALTSLRFAHGAARLVDDNRDGVADQIVEGTWDAETDVGTGAHAIQVVFSGAD